MVKKLTAVFSLIAMLGMASLWIAQNNAWAKDIEQVMQEVQEVNSTVNKMQAEQAIERIEEVIMIIEGAYPDMSLAPKRVQNKYKKKLKQLERWENVLDTILKEQALQ